jgi:hypothetical protein
VTDAPPSPADTLRPQQELAPGSEPVVDSVAEPEAQRAIAAVRVGLYVSAVRCILTYVVAPALGALGLVLGPIGLLLQLLGTLTSISGARRLHRLGHPARRPYAALAGALVLMTTASLLSYLAG